MGSALHSFILMLPVVISGALTVVALYISYRWLPVRMHKVYRQSLLTLSRAVEVKDTWSEGRGERTARYMVAVVGKLRIPGKERLMMEYAAFLHDIGNVRVPHLILNKVEPLTESEQEILRMHSVVGAEIVSQVKFLKDIAPIIRHHHEAWDGSGYPDGLRGEDIPIGSRILAVCAAYDSIILPRTGMSPLRRDDAIEEIRAGSGTCFDPTVVNAFSSVMNEKNMD